MPRSLAFRFLLDYQLRPTIRIVAAAYSNSLAGKIAIRSGPGQVLRKYPDTSLLSATLATTSSMVQIGKNLKPSFLASLASAMVYSRLLGSVLGVWNNRKANPAVAVVLQNLPARSGRSIVFENYSSRSAWP